MQALIVATLVVLHPGADIWPPWLHAPAKGCDTGQIYHCSTRGFRRVCAFVICTEMLNNPSDGSLNLVFRRNPVLTGLRPCGLRSIGLRSRRFRRSQMQCIDSILLPKQHSDANLAPNFQSFTSRVRFCMFSSALGCLHTYASKCLQGLR